MVQARMGAWVGGFPRCSCRATRVEGRPRACRRNVHGCFPPAVPGLTRYRCAPGAPAAFEQFAGGAAADQDSEVVVAQAEPLAVGLPGLQGQAAQAESDAETRAALRIGQRIQDAAVGEGLTATGRRQVEAEESMLHSLLAAGHRAVVGLVLPAEARLLDPAGEALVPGKAR